MNKELKDLLNKYDDEIYKNSYLPALEKFIKKEANDVNFIIVKSFKNSAFGLPMCSYQKNVYINDSVCKFNSPFYLYMLLHEIGHVKQYLREGEKVYDVWNLEFEEAFQGILKIEQEADDYAVEQFNKTFISDINPNIYRQKFHIDSVVSSYKIVMKDVYEDYKKSGVNNFAPELTGII